MLSDMKDKPTPSLLRADQVLQKLHALGMDDLNDNWLDHMVKTASIPSVRIGKFRRFREDVIDTQISEWLADASR